MTPPRCEHQGLCDGRDPLCAGYQGPDIDSMIARALHAAQQTIELAAELVKQAKGQPEGSPQLRTVTFRNQVRYIRTVAGRIERDL